MKKYSVTLEKMVNDLHFEIIYTPKEPSKIFINSPEINRPGLMLAGYEKYFDSDRVQLLGLGEIQYVNELPKDRQEICLERFMSKKPVIVLICRNQSIPDILLLLAKKYEVPIILTSEATSAAMSSTIGFLGVELAPRLSQHGVLVEVYGEGVLILGDSGVGKSETALELINRGHRLIADDSVEIRKVSNKTLVGSAPENIRHFIELRGVGVLNARRLFGMGAVKLTEKIDMVVELEPWNDEKVYDRLGLENEYTEILGVKVPISIVPVKPGRNLSIIIEAAAMNNRQKKMGYNAARELLNSVGMVDDVKPDKKELDIWHEF